MTARTRHAVDALSAEILGDVSTLGRKDQAFVRTRHPSTLVPLALVGRRRAADMPVGMPVLFREVVQEGGSTWTIEEPLEDADGRPLGLAALAAFGLDSAWIAAEMSGRPVEILDLRESDPDGVRRRLERGGVDAGDETVYALCAAALALRTPSPRTRVWIGGLAPCDDQAASDAEIAAFDALEADDCPQTAFDAYFDLLAIGERL